MRLYYTTSCENSISSVSSGSPWNLSMETHQVQCSLLSSKSHMTFQIKHIKHRSMKLLEFGHGSDFVGWLTIIWLDLGIVQLRLEIKEFALIIVQDSTAEALSPTIRLCFVSKLTTIYCNLVLSISALKKSAFPFPAFLTASTTALYWSRASKSLWLILSRLIPSISPRSTGLA